MEPFKPDAPESENPWVKNFIDRFAGGIPETSEAVISMPSTSQLSLEEPCLRLRGACNRQSVGR